MLHAGDGAVVGAYPKKLLWMVVVARVRVLGAIPRCAAAYRYSNSNTTRNFIATL